LARRERIALPFKAEFTFVFSSLWMDPANVAQDHVIGVIAAPPLAP
jgi:hypothetical protein